MDKEVFRVD